MSNKYMFVVPKFLIEAAKKYFGNCDVEIIENKKVPNGIKRNHRNNKTTA